MFVSSAVEHEFKSMSNQAGDYKVSICCMYAN